MDWTLWDPSFNQATQESSDRIRHGWQCDFYFGYGLDVIEETALNEKSCLQVLRILIAKADDEIVELEEDLVILQSQLAWADEEWSELCSTALREKIDGLNIAIRSLKNENLQDEHDCGHWFQLTREPAERIHDILKALLRNYFQDQNYKSIDIIAKESSSDHPGQAARLLVEEKQTRNSASNIIRNKEVEEIIITSTEKQSPDVIHHSSLNAEKLAIGHFKEASILSNSNSKINIETPTKVRSTASPILDSYLKPERRTSIEGQQKTATAMVKYSSSQYPTAYNGEKRLSNNDSKIIKEEVKAQCSKVKSIIFVSLLDPGGEGTSISETVNPADTALGSRSDALKETTEDFNANLKLSKGPETAPNNIDTSNSSLKKEEKRITNPGRVTVREASLTDTEHSVADSLLELLNQRKENTNTPRAKKNRRKIPKQVPKVELSVADNDSNSDSSPKLQRHRLKKKGLSNLECVQEPCLFEEFGLNSSSQTKFKRQWKCGMAAKNVILSRSANVRIKEENKKAPSDLSGAEEPRVALDIKVSPTLLSQNKRKRCSNLIALEGTKGLKGLDISLAKLDEDTTVSTTKEDCWTNGSHFTIDSHIETVKLHPCPTVVDYLTIVELRAIAKQQELKSYSKLRKAELAKLLGLELQDRGKRKGKRNGTSILTIKPGEL